MRLQRICRIVTRTEDSSDVSTVGGATHADRYRVLRPGDVINTDAPAGVALACRTHPHLCEGDTVELSIDGLGTRRQTFVNA